MQPKPQTLFGRLRQYAADNHWIYFVGGLAIGLLVYPFINLISEEFDDFLHDMVPEAVGITFTVFIINQLDRNREYRLLKEQLIRKMQSRDNTTAMQAVEELRALGWLMDGTLRGKNLRGAHLKDVNLYEADLRDCDLINANLVGADLYGANLEGAKVEDTQLASSMAMRWAIMPDGTRYDGRFRLYHDFEVMRRKGFDPTDPQSVAAYYDVPLEVYEAGQAWYKENQARLVADR